jgi:hypothetical protein
MSWRAPSQRLPSNLLRYTPPGPALMGELPYPMAFAARLAAGGR